MSAPAFGQRLDDGIVGVALVALVGDDALAVEARRFFRQYAVLVDRVGNARVDPALGSIRAGRHPDLEVLAAVAGGGVHEAGAGVVGDVIAIEQRHVEVVAAAAPASGWAHSIPPISSRRHVAQTLEASTLGADFNTSSASLSARISLSPAFAQLSAGAEVTS